MIQELEVALGLLTNSLIKNVNFFYFNINESKTFHDDLKPVFNTFFYLFLSLDENVLKELSVL